MRMSWWSFRWYFLKPVRLAIRFQAWLVSQIPGTTNCEKAEMGLTPCQRCMGYAVEPRTIAVGDKRQ